jgi:transposase InsO family protein
MTKQTTVRLPENFADNGSPYVYHLWADTLESVNIRHIRTRPYRPQTNGKAERYQRTLATEFTYANEWRSNLARTDALNSWLHEYNHDRCHTAIDGATHQPRQQPH